MGTDRVVLGDHIVADTLGKLLLHGELGHLIWLLLWPLLHDHVALMHDVGCA